MSDTPSDAPGPRRRSRKAQPPEPAGTEASSPVGTGPERIAKVMARSGLCSRRDAEVWIKDGRVAVNGKVLASPALNVGPDDRITVDGRPVTARERTRLFMYHKPRGLVTTARDPEGRPTVFEALPDELPRVVSVGRLDINTEGLLLLTNDGGLARVLELPATGWLRRYRVRANGFVTPEKLEALKDGITVDGVDYAGIEAALDRTQGANQWLTIGLREGKNREIKRVLEHLGLAVNRLIRLSFGPFQLGDLAEGAVAEVRPRVLKDQLGDALAAEAGVIWEDAVQAEVVTAAVADRAKAGKRDAPPAEVSRPPRTGDARPDGSRRERSSQERPTQERPRQDRPAPRARPHVSALRAEAAPAGDEPRKRISRRTTEDRNGRTVKIERVTVDSRERHRSGEGGTSRNARNFARARRDEEATDGTTAVKRGRARPAQPAAPGEPPSRVQRGRAAERAGGFSSGRPLTGRALKDGKVRRNTDKPEGSRGPRAGGTGPRPGGTGPRSGGTGPRPGGKPRGRS
jgi:23S rRNA pseudouridine2605 synthase